MPRRWSLTQAIILVVSLVLIATAWSLGVELSSAFNLHHRVSLLREVFGGAALTFVAVIIVYLNQAHTTNTHLAPTQFALSLWLSGGIANLISIFAFNGCADFIPLPLPGSSLGFASPGDLIIFTSIPIMLHSLTALLVSRWREMASVNGRIKRLRAVLSSQL